MDADSAYLAVTAQRTAQFRYGDALVTFHVSLSTSADYAVASTQ